MKPLQNKVSNIQILDNRLLTAAGFVRKNSICADIGCDHGKLSVYLSQSGKCKKIIACDANLTPLEKAKKALKDNNCTNVECRLGDGLNIVGEDEVDDIVIAGLSGVTIADIIKEAINFHKEKFRFVFVPASKPDFLRRFLCENGFEIIEEKVVMAAGRVYTVMHVCYSGLVFSPSELFCVVGKIKGKTQETNAYKTKLLNHLQKQGNKALIKEVEQWFSQEI